MNLWTVSGDNIYQIQAFDYKEVLDTLELHCLQFTKHKATGQFKLNVRREFEGGAGCIVQSYVGTCIARKPVTVLINHTIPLSTRL